METKTQNGVSLLDFLSFLAIILILAAILISYSPNGPHSVYHASLAAPGGAAPCKATPTNICLLDPVLPAATKIGYTFVWASDSKPAWVAYETKETPVTIVTRDQRLVCAEVPAATRNNTTGAAACTSARFAVP
jgi:hypothetical protein